MCVCMWARAHALRQHLFSHVVLERRHIHGDLFNFPSGEYQTPLFAVAYCMLPVNAVLARVVLSKLKYRLYIIILIESPPPPRGLQRRT